MSNNVGADDIKTDLPCDDGLLEGDEALQLRFMGERFRLCDRQMAEERKVFLERIFLPLKPVWDAIQAERSVSASELALARDFLSRLDLGLNQGWFTLMDFGISPENFSFACFSLSFYSQYAERLPAVFPQRFDFTLADWHQSREAIEALQLDPAQYRLSLFLKLQQSRDSKIHASYVLLISTPSELSHPRPVIQKGTFFSSSVPVGTARERLHHLARRIFCIEAIHLCAREQKLQTDQVADA